MKLEEALKECKNGKHITCQELINHYCWHLWYYEEQGDFYGAPMIMGESDKYFSLYDLKKNFKKEDWIVFDKKQVEINMKRIFEYMNDRLIILKEQLSDSEDKKYFMYYRKNIEDTKVEYLTIQGIKKSTSCIHLLHRATKEEL